MKYIYLIVFTCITNFCFGQGKITDFDLGVAVGNASDELNDAQRLKLEEKLTLIVNNSGEATVAFDNDFYLYPKVSIEESGAVEGGMENMTITTIEINLFIGQVSSEVIYNTMVKKVKGSGKTQEQAISNAISKWQINDNTYTEFIKTAKQKILEYYQHNCSKIVRDADDLGATHNYEAAISLLGSVPNSIACFDEARKKAVAFYLKYQTQLCATNIGKAKGEIAVKNYDGALEALSLIDPEADCSAEAKKLTKQISDKVDKQDTKDYKLEELRINAIKEIAKDYFASKAAGKKR